MGKKVNQNTSSIKQKRNHSASVAQNKSLISTNNTRAGQNPGLVNSFQSSPANNQITKSQIMDEAWKNQNIANTVYSNGQQNNTCCDREHLPHNEKNPQCYRNASGLASKIPYAG